MGPVRKESLRKPAPRGCPAAQRSGEAGPTPVLCLQLHTCPISRQDDSTFTRCKLNHPREHRGRPGTLPEEQVYPALLTLRSEMSPPVTARPMAFPRFTPWKTRTPRHTALWVLTEK